MVDCWLMILRGGTSLCRDDYFAICKIKKKEKEISNHDFAFQLKTQTAMTHLM